MEDGSEQRTRSRAGVREPTVARLPAYHRVLLSFDERGASTISSADLSDAIGTNAATVRQDLAASVRLGPRGTGYDVLHLLRRIEDALAVHDEWRVAIVGIGNLRRALAQSQGFNSSGFVVAALIDVDRKVVVPSVRSRISGSRLSRIHHQEPSDQHQGSHDPGVV